MLFSCVSVGLNFKIPLKVQIEKLFDIKCKPTVPDAPEKFRGFQRIYQYNICWIWNDVKNNIIVCTSLNIDFHPGTF